METVDINNVPIFSCGRWHGKGSAPDGDVIDEKFLDGVVSTFMEVGAKVKPRMIVGHDKKNSEKFTGMPALGWITDLRRDGKTLYANLKSVPKKIKTLIDNKAYGRLSPAFFKKLSINDKEYSNVMDHLALLGAELPADMDLDYMLTNVYENKEIDLQYISQDTVQDTVEQIKMEDVNMDELKELKEKILKFENDQKKLEEENSKYKQYMADLEKENADIKVKLESEKKAKHDAELNFMLEEKIKEGKLLPSQKSVLFALCSDMDNIKTYSYIENNEQKKVEGKEIDLLKSFLDLQPKLVNFEEAGQAVRVETVDMDDEEKLLKKADEYMKKYNCSQKEAILAIYKEEGGK